MAFIEKKKRKSKGRSSYGEYAWIVRYRDLTGREKQATFNRRDDANRARIAIERAKSLGEDWTPYRQQNMIDLRSIMLAYLDFKQLSLQPSTLVKYRNYLGEFERYLDERFRGRRVIEPKVLTRPLIADFCSHLRESGRHGRPRADLTVIKIKEVVELAWIWAYDDERFEQHVPRPRRFKEIKRPAPRETKAATELELRRVIAAIGPEQWQRNLAVVLAFTGLRVNQAMRLKWTDFDFGRGELRIRPELGKSRQERRGRHVPISEHLLTEMSAWSQMGEYVIHTNRRGHRERIARPRDMARAWSRAGVRTEVWQQRPHHAFRKAFHSILTEKGANADAISYLVGHDRGLRGIYTDVRALGLKAAIGRFPNVLNPPPESQIVDGGFSSSCG